MIILGIDPGIATVGYGFIEYVGNKAKHITHGVILTPAKTRLEFRLEQIYDEMNKLIAYYKPHTVGIEELFFNTNAKTAIHVAHARGVLMLAAQLHKLDIFEYTPLQVKQAVAGYGRAEKKQVMAMVKMLLNLSEIPKPDDAADALAIAVCHAHNLRF